jgi:uncharacterized membrane protein YfcA|nr:MAG TPA: hypothetical protein [Caudoviricetes sp.]
MIAVLVICIIIIISVGVATMIASIINEEIINFIFGLILSILGVIGFLGFEELVNNDNSQYIPAEPLARNQTQTVFTTDEGTYIANGLYSDGTYLLTVDGKDVLAVWQAVEGEEVGLG